MTKRRKRKFKKGFKIFIFLFFLVLIAFALYILNKEKVVNIESSWQEVKTFFVKDNNKENVVESIDTNDFASLFKTRLPSKGLEFASSSEISSNGDMKIYLKNTEGESGYVYVNTNDKAEYVWITFVSAIDAEPLKTQLADNLYALDYIDVRFSNKVFYKFKDETVKASEVNESKNNEVSNQNNEAEETTSETSPSSAEKPEEEGEILRAEAFSTQIPTSSSTQ